MAYQTIPQKFTSKHIDKITNVRCFSLENGFNGELIGGAAALDFALNRLGCRLQIDKIAGRGRVRAHGNLWYEFDYAAASEKEAA